MSNAILEQLLMCLDIATCTRFHEVGLLEMEMATTSTWFRLGTGCTHETPNPINGIPYHLEVGISSKSKAMLKGTICNLCFPRIFPRSRTRVEFQLAMMFFPLIARNWTHLHPPNPSYLILSRSKNDDEPFDFTAFPWFFNSFPIIFRCQIAILACDSCCFPCVAPLPQTLADQAETEALNLVAFRMQPTNRTKRRRRTTKIVVLHHILYAFYGRTTVINMESNNLMERIQDVILVFLYGI